MQHRPLGVGEESSTCIDGWILRVRVRAFVCARSCYHCNQHCLTDSHSCGMACDDQRDTCGVRKESITEILHLHLTVAGFLRVVKEGCHVPVKESPPVSDRFVQEWLV